MLDPLPIPPVSAPVCGTIRPPGSKSITNRAFVVAALAEGRSRLAGVLDSQDTRVMVDSLRRLGIDVRHDRDTCIAEVVGCGGRPPASQADLWLENSGTSIRFLTALCTLGNGDYRLDGNTRMRERPIGDLVQALTGLGADVTCEAGNGCPPVIIRGNQLPGGATTVAGSISSQFLSALLMAAPCASEAVELNVAGDLVSLPYVEMTLGVMARFGADWEVQHAPGTNRPVQYRLHPQSYRATDYNIEPDASAASYFFAAAAVTGGEVTVEGLSPHALQGDVQFVEALERMGCHVGWLRKAITVRGGPLRGIDIDMNAISDTAQTLAAVALFAEGPTRIRNVAHMRHKETDRIAAVAAELRKLGAGVEEHDDGLTIHPQPLRPATIDTYDDHRMAMSFAIIGLKSPGVQIANPGCTAKTYPRFFDDLNRLCGRDTLSEN